MIMRAVIVDDEPLARQVLREMLAGEPDLEIVAECANGFEAVRAVAELKPELLFLDVQMPKLDGFEVLELLHAGEARDLAVVFVTAHEQHALRAFEVQALDYLLKPFSKERLRAAIERALPRRVAAVPRLGPTTRLVVRDGTKITIIPLEKLEYAEAQDDYVALACDGKKHLRQQTIASLEAALPAAEFVRVHRSFIVRLDQVARVEPAGSDSHAAVLRSGVKLPVSRAGMARLKQALGDN